MVLSVQVGGCESGHRLGVLTRTNLKKWQAQSHLNICAGPLTACEAHLCWRLQFVMSEGQARVRVTAASLSGSTPQWSAIQVM